MSAPEENRRPQFLRWANATLQRRQTRRLPSSSSPAPAKMGTASSRPEDRGAPSLTRAAPSEKTSSGQPLQKDASRPQEDASRPPPPPSLPASPPGPPSSPAAPPPTEEPFTPSSPTSPEAEKRRQQEGAAEIKPALHGASTEADQRPIGSSETHEHVTAEETQPHPGAGGDVPSGEASERTKLPEENGGAAAAEPEKGEGHRHHLQPPEDENQKNRAAAITEPIQPGREEAAAPAGVTNADRGRESKLQNAEATKEEEEASEGEPKNLTEKKPSLEISPESAGGGTGGSVSKLHGNAATTKEEEEVSEGEPKDSTEKITAVKVSPESSTGGTNTDRGSMSKLQQNAEATKEEEASVGEPKDSTGKTPTLEISPESSPSEKPRNGDGRPPAERTTETAGEKTRPQPEKKAAEAAEERDKQAPAHLEKEQTPPGRTAKGKEGSKVAVSAISRASTSEDQQPGSLHKEIREGISRLVQSLAVRHSKHEDGGGQGISMITLAGENHGAAMTVGYGYVNGKEGGQDQATRESAKKKGTEEGRASPAMATSVNSNVQAINSSILHDSCCRDDHPGVHFVISNGSPPAEYAEPAVAGKPGSPRVWPPQPVVRRRCLRALLMESGDEDSGNAGRRRHGCRYTCDDGGKRSGGALP